MQQSLLHTFRRYTSLYTHKISALPIAILMPHSACNCRCIMCDIWKDNKNLKQLTEEDVKDLLSSLKHLGTKQVVMSGGEALLNNNFFKLCQLLNDNNISVTLLSTGLSLKRNAADIVKNVHDVIVSVDGDEALHDAIRNIPGAYNKIKEGVEAIKAIQPAYRITGRTVIHKINFRAWDKIIDAAKQIGLSQISFLPADASSQAFNREVAWNADRQAEVLPERDELDELKTIINRLEKQYAADFSTRYIAESPSKIRDIYHYYAACYGLNAFPPKKCNAPWVSVVVEADGNVRPCFFHPVQGNIRSNQLSNIINSPEAIDFRRKLDMDKNETCKRCVCSLNLPPRMNPAII